MRILVVEDEYKLADIIATKVKKEKYDVDISTDHEEGKCVIIVTHSQNVCDAVDEIYDLKKVK